jgi:hypothetical protein
MGQDKFVRTRGILLKQASRFAIIAGALWITGASAELADATEAGSSSATPTQADAVNQALLKKMEAMEQRIKSLEAQVKQQNAPANAGKPAPSDATGATKQSDKSKTDKSQRRQVATRQIQSGW